eukprot:Phypoly_transcript_18676.p1 GENE.Phypoly_transcript_18676~~Phypoly_transcript_18676.p1  ORF type:complete len:140 (-),score=3.35 Phypoly_transcript_18676:299-718(-)
MGELKRMVASKTWTPETEKGTSTCWVPLPTQMALEFKLDHEANVLMEGYISRVQHDLADVNTSYRLVLNPATSREQIVSVGCTGRHEHWSFKSIRLNGILLLPPGNHLLQMQFKTNSGTEFWPSDDNGTQHRQLHAYEL